MSWKRLLLPGLALQMLAASAAGAWDLTVLSRIPVRTGPGNYYEILSIADRGTTLAITGEIDGWYRISLAGNRDGYVSAKALGPRKPAAGVKIEKLAREKGVGTAASSGMMAAIRGVADLGPFVRRYAEQRKLDPKSLERFTAAAFN